MNDLSSSSAPAPTIVFSHANSFPAPTYELLFEQWREAGYAVHAIDKLGHDPRYPVTVDWPHLVRQLHDFITHQVGHPVYLVGHSLGGYLSLMLAHRHPSWARGVVVLDSPLLDGWRAAGIGLVKKLGQMQTIMPSRIAAQRCHQWSSLAEARAHFSAKPKFAAFHPRILDDYLHHGTVGAHHEAPRALSFQREVERDIYNTMPHKLMREFRRQPLSCPVAFIGGRRSYERLAIGMSGIRQVAGARVSLIEGTHLYPFERPSETATEVIKWLQQFKT
jgi:pimeloyl-ACP methyl ester carboxylesterase